MSQEYWELYARIPCVTKLALLEELEGQNLHHLLEGGREEENFSHKGDLIISMGWGRYEEYCEILDEEYCNPFQGEPMNADFQNLSLPDPRFYLLGAICLVIVVDESKLGSLPCPNSFHSLCSPIYHNKIVYTSDEGLLENLILPMLRELYKPAEVQCFQDNMELGMHPSQMMQRGTHKGEACIFIMPYFFADLKSSERHVKLVWPEEGAFALPIFMTCKKTVLDEANKQDKILRIRAFLKALKGVRFAECLSAHGKFPVSLPHYQNHLPGKIYLKKIKSEKRG